MKPKNIFITLILIALLATAGVFLWKNYNPDQSYSQTNEKEVVKIGAVLPLTGWGANYGKSIKQGIEIALSEINEAGGINGKKLKVIFEDSQTDPQAGISAFNKLIEVDKVPLVIGSISSVVLSVAPIADEKKIVLLNSSAASPKICEGSYEYLFSIMVNGDNETNFMADYLIRQKAEKNIVVVYSNNTSGLHTKNKFVEYVENAGGNIVSEVSYELGETNFKTHLLKLKESNAKTVYLIAFSSKEFSDILRQSKELGIDVKWYSYSGFETKETINYAGDSANDVIYTYPKYDSTDKKFDGFQEKFKSLHNNWADIYTVTSYDGIYFISQALKKYGTSSNKLKEGLKKIDSYDGVFKTINLDEDQCINPELMLKIVKNQKFEVLD